MWLTLPSRLGSVKGGTRSETPHNPYAVRPMTRAEVERGVRMRKHAFGKPAQQIADEAGVSLKSVNAVLRMESVSPEAYAALTGYLRTPYSKLDVINNRAARAAEKGPRAQIEKRIRLLARIAFRYDVRAKSPATRASMTVGELHAYFWNLDRRVKEAVLKRYPDIAKRFILPDSLQAWEWIERLDQIAEHLKKYGDRPKGPTAQFTSPGPRSPRV